MTTISPNRLTEILNKAREEVKEYPTWKKEYFSGWFDQGRVERNTKEKTMNCLKDKSGRLLNIDYAEDRAYRSEEVRRHGVRGLPKDRDLADCDLQNANLQNANLQFFMLLDTNFQDANLDGANFYGAYLWGKDITSKNYRAARIGDFLVYGCETWHIDDDDLWAEAHEFHEKPYAAEECERIRAELKTKVSRFSKAGGKEIK